LVLTELKIRLYFMIFFISMLSLMKISFSNKIFNVLIMITYVSTVMINLLSLLVNKQYNLEYVKSLFL